MLETVHYIILGVVAFVGIVWVLSSMGIIKNRASSLRSRKREHMQLAMRNIAQTYSYLENLPEHSRAAVYEHLDNGMINHALDAARSNHDVYHFFKNFD